MIECVNSFWFLTWDAQFWKWDRRTAGAKEILCWDSIAQVFLFLTLKKILKTFDSNFYFGKTLLNDICCFIDYYNTITLLTIIISDSTWRYSIGWDIQRYKLWQADQSVDKHYRSAFYTGHETGIPPTLLPGQFRTLHLFFDCCFMPYSRICDFKDGHHHYGERKRVTIRWETFPRPP